MSALLYILMGGLLACALLEAALYLRDKHKYGLNHNVVRSLSTPSKRILAEYHKVPVAHRFGDILPVLKALDVKATKKAADSHFMHWGYESSYFKWQCNCYNDCIGTDYLELYKTISGIQTELEKRDHALAVAGVQSGLDEFTHILNGLKQERNLIYDVTKEIV